MKVVIVEDEIPAADKLELLLGRLERGISVVSRLDSVKAAVAWFDNNPNEYDLIFMDIQLLDGRSFEIFSDIKIRKPIIFTTAFQEYSLDAFKVNSIDYLLKPITLKALEAAIDKYENLRKELLEGISAAGSERPELEVYKNRFMVKFGDHIRSVPVEDVNYFFAEGRNVYLYTSNDSKYIIDFTLEELESLLKPEDFLRVNRSFIIYLSSIRDVLVYSNSRLKIITEPSPVKEIIVSREKVAHFKAWFDGMKQD